MLAQPLSLRKTRNQCFSSWITALKHWPAAPVVCNASKNTAKGSRRPVKLLLLSLLLKKWRTIPGHNQVASADADEEAANDKPPPDMAVSVVVKDRESGHAPVIQAVATYAGIAAGLVLRVHDQRQATRSITLAY